LLPALNCKGEAQTLLNGQINEYCCASHRLAREPDFKNHKPGLEEAVLNSGHLFDNYQKFHCETNWIERYWKGSKDNARKNCDYTFASLKKNLNKQFENEEYQPHKKIPVFYKQANVWELFQHMRKKD
jgi:hypothetical protein